MKMSFFSIFIQFSAHIVHQLQFQFVSHPMLLAECNEIHQRFENGSALSDKRRNTN